MTNSDWLFETFIDAFMIGTKLSGVALMATPLNTSWQETGIVTPEMLFEVLVIVQYTAVLIAAVAFELAVWANAPTVDNARAAVRHTYLDIDKFLFFGVNLCYLRPSH